MIKLTLTVKTARKITIGYFPPNCAAQAPTMTYISIFFKLCFSFHELRILHFENQL